MNGHVNQLPKAAIEDAIFGLLATRREGATICPSEVARTLAPDDRRWRELMPQVRQAAQELAENHRLDVTRRGVRVDATSRGGPIRLGLPVKRDKLSELAEQAKVGAEKNIAQNGRSYVALIDADRNDLRADMSLNEFDNGYFYALALKQFAREIGIVVGNLRKIELEHLIRECLLTGRAPSRKHVLQRKTGQPRDRLATDAVVVNYVGDESTKTFLLKCVHAKGPGLGNKSGQWYWLNDWRRKKQGALARFLYLDLANHLRELMQTEGRLPQIPSARMNNFMTDLRADPLSAGTSREDAMKAWMWLKQQHGPKTYAEYRRRLSNGGT